MIVTIAATLALALIAMTPGYILISAEPRRAGMASAAMAASLTVVLAIAALCGVAVELVSGSRIPALSIVPVALIASAAALALKRKPRSLIADVEWQGIALGVMFVIYGLFVQWIAVRVDDAGALQVHGWYNADWFKHLGHVGAIANFGLPAADAFNSAQPLYYYWLAYVLPAAGVAVGGEAWSALATANTIITFLFTSVFYGLLRRFGIGRNIALLIGAIALFASAPTSFVFQMVAGIGFEGVLNFTSPPKGPALLTLSQYIPHHMLALTLLVGWFVLQDETEARWLALAGLVTVMTVSTLLGAMVLTAYGLYRLWIGREKAVPELTVMAAIAGGLVIAMHVVQIGNIGSAIESPLLTNDRPDLPLYSRICSSVMFIIGNAGLPLLITLVGLYYWRGDDEKETEAKVFAVALIVTSLIAAVAVEILLTQRLAIETRIRAVNLPGIANAIVGAWMFQYFWKQRKAQRAAAFGGLVLVVLVALPSAGLRTAWHGRIGDEYTTIIPADDRVVLNAMRRDTDARAIVMQYPEPPVLADGRGGDAWAAILGQRAVTASLRATDYAVAQPRIEAAEQFFSGGDEPIPHDVELIYISRTLHPDTYDALAGRMAGEKDFRISACYADACLFERRDTNSE